MAFLRGRQVGEVRKREKEELGSLAKVMAIGCQKKMGPGVMFLSKIGGVWGGKSILPFQGGGHPPPAMGVGPS